MDYIVPQVEVLEVAAQTIFAASQDSDLVLGNGGNLDIFDI